MNTKAVYFILVSSGLALTVGSLSSMLGAYLDNVHLSSQYTVLDSYFWGGGLLAGLGMGLVMTGRAILNEARGPEE